MKALIRFAATLGLVSSTLVGVVFGISPSSIALPETEVIDNLQGVPIYSITDSEGLPLLTVREGQEKGIANLFLSLKDAEAAIEQLKQTNPDIAQQAQLVIVSLPDIYQKVKEAAQQSDSPDFRFVPMQQEVNSAVSLLKQQGQEVSQFRGVPLFFATVEVQREGQSAKQEIYLPAPGSDQIPLFFEQEQAQKLAELFKQQEPGMASDVKIRVLPLEYVIELFENESGEAIKNMFLVRSQEAESLVQELLKQQGEAQPGNNPGN